MYVHMYNVAVDTQIRTYVTPPPTWLMTPPSHPPLHSHIRAIVGWQRESEGGDPRALAARSGVAQSPASHASTGPLACGGSCSRDRRKRGPANGEGSGWGGEGEGRGDGERKGREGSGKSGLELVEAGVNTYICT